MFVLPAAEPAESLPEPPRPGREPRRAPARRRTLNRDGIVDAALRVLDAEGLDAVTMRRVAQELGTGGASLYAHVDGKDGLIDLVLERVIGEVRLPESDPDPDRWQEDVKAIAREMRRVMTAHRDIARATLANIPLGANALTVMDRLMGSLRAGGLPDQVCAWAGDLLGLFVTAVAVEDSIYGTKLTPEQAERYFTELGQYMHSLPAERFPHMAALAGPMTAGGGDERFEFGLNVIVSGLAAQAKPPRR